MVNQHLWGRNVVRKKSWMIVITDHLKRLVKSNRLSLSKWCCGERVPWSKLKALQWNINVRLFLYVCSSQNASQIVWKPLKVKRAERISVLLSHLCVEWVMKDINSELDKSVVKGKKSSTTFANYCFIFWLSCQSLDLQNHGSLLKHKAKQNKNLN